MSYVIITPRTNKQIVTKQTKDGFYSRAFGCYSTYAQAKHYDNEQAVALAMMVLRPYYPLAFYADTKHFI